MYNAAYFAGLQLDTSQPHSLFIDRYPAGREATLNYPDIDLAWTNDTDAPVLVRAAAGEDSVTVSLYGDNGGRTVSAVNGSRRPVPGGDFSIEVTRVVRHPGGRTDRSSRTTTYDLLDE
jgi:vancomycin resistance protein YoaR